MTSLISVFGMCFVYASIVTSSHKVASRRVSASAGSFGFLPSFAEEQFIEQCLTSRSTNDHHGDNCQRLRSMAREMEDESTRSRVGRDAESLTTKYHFDFNSMVLDMVGLIHDDHGNLNTEQEVMSNLASCASFSVSARQQWRQFYKHRLNDSNIRMATLMPEVQELHGEEVEVTFDNKNMSKFAGHELIAVDLALQRAPPSQIDEYFGKYEIVVEHVREGSENIVLYQSEQASCPTTDGYMMVASLTDLDHMWEWFFHGDQAMKLRIRVQPLQQLFAGTSNSDVRVEILRRALSLSFILKPTPESQLVDQLPLHLDHTISRSRRSVQRRSPDPESACSRVGYRVDFRSEAQQGSVAYPPVADVWECYGACRFPLPSFLNATSHALLVLKEILLNPSVGRAASIHCAPIGWNDMSYTYYGDHGYLVMGVLTKMIVTRCGCI